MPAARVRPKPSNEGGFTLVEILASLVVIAIAGLAMTAFFVHALSYAKGNQNKTVMINLARNTLFYMQKESKFDKVKDFFSAQNNKIDSAGCPVVSSSCTEYETLVKDSQTLVYILNPKINGIQYDVTISYQEKLHSDLDSNTDSATADGGRIGTYLLPIKVEVEEVLKNDNGQAVDPSKRKRTEVEGYITDESIR
ncbi:prepilin-type N-terminal cleavage/methylation domain-containing protein [Paenibacillus taihuensis]|uniref:Prepilin-type N-terminal cleavage/methylation domain-containing protein n=1 Tax=Paenibacillus taihuensis TaxID=1156355 RepID=A0A3D9QZT2_9BACL|nr:prepilin-type N-terminal cleavage/methylation domain-containing protein [Paenibacillus taihuensis]REE66680.1 prepilin-type N-terminal cleavage/methylation domain-containing protein [Paenibacillus taihuensis]